jgi:hypothetical protein
MNLRPGSHRAGCGIRGRQRRHRRGRARLQALSSAPSCRHPLCCHQLSSWDANALQPAMPPSASTPSQFFSAPLVLGLVCQQAHPSSVGQAVPSLTSSSSSPPPLLSSLLLVVFLPPLLRAPCSLNVPTAQRFLQAKVNSLRCVSNYCNTATDHFLARPAAMAILTIACLETAARTTLRVATTTQHCRLAQLVERLHDTQEVVGSSPTLATSNTQRKDS